MSKLDIAHITEKILTKEEYNEVLEILKDKNIFSKMKELDSKIGGAGVHNINIGNTGRYHPKDRDIFRPIQYIYMYLKYDQEDMEWITREIVHMSGLHMEAIIKRFSNITRLPLGQALTDKIIVSKIGRQTMTDLKLIVKPYNNSKHHLHHNMDTHLFPIEDAILYYVSVRKIAQKILPIINLQTPQVIWEC